MPVARPTIVLIDTAVAWAALPVVLFPPVALPEVTLVGPPPVPIPLIAPVSPGPAPMPELTVPVGPEPARRSELR